MRRLRDGSPLHLFLLDAARLGQPLALPAPVLMEISYGAHLNTGPGRQRLIFIANWIAGLTTPRGGNVLLLLSMSARAALAAGGWANDALVAAIAWDSGYDLVSEDSDFQAIAAKLPGLQIVPPAAALNLP